MANLTPSQAMQLQKKQEALKTLQNVYSVEGKAKQHSSTQKDLLNPIIRTSPI